MWQTLDFQSDRCCSEFVKYNAAMEYAFTVKFDLPDTNAEPEQYVDALYEAGCDDATLGIGQRGRIGLNFVREADCAGAALLSAMRDVLRAIPGAMLADAMGNDIEQALYWYHTAHLATFRQMTPEQLVAAGRTDALLEYVESLSAGALG